MLNEASDKKAHHKRSTSFHRGPLLLLTNAPAQFVIRTPAEYSDPFGLPSRIAAM